MTAFPRRWNEVFFPAGWRCLGVHVLGDLTMASFAVTESGAVDLLLKHGDSFDAVRVDRKVSPAAVQSLTPPNHEEDWLWNLDLIDEAKVAGTATDGSYTRDEAYNGDGVLVYIIDTGIDKVQVCSDFAGFGQHNGC